MRAHAFFGRRRGELARRKAAGACAPLPPLPSLARPAPGHERGPGNVPAHAHTIPKRKLTRPVRRFLPALAPLPSVAPPVAAAVAALAPCLTTPKRVGKVLTAGAAVTAVESGRPEVDGIVAVAGRKKADFDVEAVFFFWSTALFRKVGFLFRAATTVARRAVKTECPGPIWRRTHVLAQRHRSLGEMRCPARKGRPVFPARTSRPSLSRARRVPLSLFPPASPL